MELIRGYYNLKPRHFGCVATIGNFDGLHRGHRELLQQLTDSASTLGLPALLVTFVPRPEQYFNPDNSAPQLMNLRDKLTLLEQVGVDRVLCLAFNEKLAHLSAGDFIDNLLVEKLGLKHLIIGADFRFGHHRQGTLETLISAGRQQGFTVATAPTVNQQGERVSSTRIRRALQQGNLPLAQQLLNRPYTMTGKVVAGDGVGKTLGYATANVHWPRPLPMTGVFAVRAAPIQSPSANAIPGMANLGFRPTLQDRQQRLEVHLLDYQGNLYQQFLRVEFIARLRDEQRFPSLTALQQQIQRDEAEARRLFSLATVG